MKQRSRIVYLFVGGLLVLIALLVYAYQEYLGEDSKSNVEDGQNPIIAQKINGVITHTAVSTVGHPQILNVTYTDLNSNEAAHFTIYAEYGPRMHPGDTVTKDRGEKTLLIYQKDGNIATVPID